MDSELVVSRFTVRFVGCFALFFAAALIGVLATAGAIAQRSDDSQTYPNRAVRIIVPFPPGGPTAGIITTRLAGYLFNREAELDAQYIPFNGSAPTVQGLLTGAVDYIIDGAATSLPLVHDGKLRALAKLNSRPLPALPEVMPLAVEAGIPAHDDISTWVGLVAPAGTARPVIEKIQREIVKMYADPVVAGKLEKSGISAVSSTPEEFDAFVRKELDRWGQVFKDSGIQLN